MVPLRNEEGFGDWGLAFGIRGRRSSLEGEAVPTSTTAFFPQISQISQIQPLGFRTLGPVSR